MTVKEGKPSIFHPSCEYKNGVFFVNDRRVGHLSNVAGHTVYKSYRRRDIHFHKNVGGWGLQLWILDWMKTHAVHYVVLDVKGEGHYHASVRDFGTFGFPSDYEGHGKQVILRESFFSFGGLRARLDDKDFQGDDKL